MVGEGGPVVAAGDLPGPGAGEAAAEPGDAVAHGGERSRLSAAGRLVLGRRRRRRMLQAEALIDGVQSLRNETFEA